MARASWDNIKLIVRHGCSLLYNTSTKTTMMMMMNLVPTSNPTAISLSPTIPIITPNKVQTNKPYICPFNKDSNQFTEKSLNESTDKTSNKSTGSSFEVRIVNLLFSLSMLDKLRTDYCNTLCCTKRTCFDLFNHK